jgi:5'(3')-deoxyribonucleotidase
MRPECDPEPIAIRQTTRMQTIGVDIDGVLADQVTGVLDRVREKHGVALTYEEVVHWDVPLGPTSFVPEIAKAMLDPAYVLGMGVHPGAREMLQDLRASFHVHLLTVRPPEAMDATVQWLASSGLEYDELVPAKEALKSRHSTAGLVDDYPKNLQEFLHNTGGVGVLVDQPWNQDTSWIVDTWRDDRLERVTDLATVPSLIERMLRMRSQ